MLALELRNHAHRLAALEVRPAHDERLHRRHAHGRRPGRRAHSRGQQHEENDPESDDPLHRPQYASRGPPVGDPLDEWLVVVLELELPGSEPVRSGVDDPIRVVPVSFAGHVGQSRDLDVRHPRSRCSPRPVPGALEHAEVGRDVQVARRVVLHDVGQRQVAQRAVEARPGGRAVARVVGHREDVTRSRRRRGVEPAVRDPGVVLVVRVDEDPGHVPVWIVRRQRVEPDERDVARRIRVRVVRDEHAAVRGRGPERRRVRCRTLDRGHRTACAVAPAGGRERRRAELDPVAARNREVAGELVAVLPELGQRHRAHAVRLRPDDGVLVVHGRRGPARVHRPRHDRVAGDRDVELVAALAVDRVGDPVPVRDRAVGEVHVRRRVEERVEAEVRVGRVEARLAAVAPEGLEPRVSASVVLPRSVVLRPTLQLSAVERAHREALELNRPETSVHALEPGRNRRQQLVTAAQVRLGEPTRVAVARAVRELAARPDDPAVRGLEELARVPRVRHEAVLVGMHPVRMVDVRRVHRHVREVHPGIGRAQHGAVVRDVRPVGAVLVVLVRAAEVHDVRLARRRVDEVVVPALAGAEVERVPGRSRRIVARQLGEDRHARRDVVAAVEPAVLDGAGVPFADVHPRLAVRQTRDRDVRPRGADRRVQRRLDLRPRVPAVSRAPDASRVRSCVEGVRVRRVDLDVTHAARCARRRVVRDRGDVRAAVRRARRAGMDHRPRGPAVRRAVEAPLRRPRDQRPVLADAAVAAHGRVSADREGRAGIDRVRIAGLDPDRPDTASVERRAAVRARPVVAAVGRLVEADACDTTAAARVALTGSDPERVRARIVRVDRDRPGRVDPEAPAQVLPVRVRRQRVVRAPDPSARRGDPHPALRAVAPVCRRPAAVRVDGEVGRATCRRVLLRHVRVRVPVRRELVQRRLRADLLPRQVFRSRPERRAEPAPVPS